MKILWLIAIEKINRLTVLVFIHSLLSLHRTDGAARIHVQQQGSTTKMLKGWRLKNALMIHNIVNDIIDKWRHSKNACRKLCHPHKSLGAQQESYEYIKILEQILHPDARRCQREAASMCARHANTSPWHIDFLIFFLKPILVGPVCCVRLRLTAWTAPFVVHVEGKQWKVTDKGTFVQRDRWSRTDWQTKRAYKWLRIDGLWRMLRARGAGEGYCSGGSHAPSHLSGLSSH